MVQPQARVDSALQWDMTGAGDALAAGGQGSMGASSSQGSLRVPPELASNEIVHRLIGDNRQLRDALRRSNVALKERCEEMGGWQQRMREEREFLGTRFREARELVERLGRENKALQLQLGHTGAGPPSAGQDGGHAGAGTSGEVPQNQPGAEKEAKEATEVADPPSPLQSLDDSSVRSSVSTVFLSVLDSLTYGREDGGEGEGWVCSKPTEGGDEYLQLLKSHKEKLEEGMQELRRRNEELEREREDLCSTNAQLQAKLTQIQPTEGGNEFLQLIKSHKEKLEEGMQELRRRNEELEREREQLQDKLTQIQGCSVTEETPQRSAAHPSGSDGSTLARLTEQLQATQCRHRELQEQLDCLQKSAVQRDRTEALLKQREKEYAQLVKDYEAVKAQVTSLLGELNERKSCLDNSEKERMQVEEKLSARSKELYSIQREAEQQRKQHSVAVDQLRLKTQGLEAALRNERLVLTEEKRKLAQLQHAYTQLFKDYDNISKNDMANRLVEAERALALKQELIDKLKEEVEQQRGTLETVPVLTAQAEIYKADFRAEREAREKLHQRKEELQEQLRQALMEVERLKLVNSRAGMEEMQRRHREDSRTNPRPAVFPGATVPFSPAQAPAFQQHDFRCPKCQYQAPDIDTLQIHVMDCIQ